MDTSKEYIKMCEKAEEIQKSWFPTLGDYGASKRSKIVHLLSWDSDVDFSLIKTDEFLKEKLLFIPCQDQLHLLSKLSWQEFDWKCANEYPLAITKEQAGIQVVMSQFNKEWKKNKWLDKTTP